MNLAVTIHWSFKIPLPFALMLSLKAEKWPGFGFFVFFVFLPALTI